MFIIRSNLKRDQTNNHIRRLHEAVIVSAARTPVGSFLGSLSSLTAPQLSSITIKRSLEKAKIAPDQVDEVLLGNVLQAGQGQAPARQAALHADLPKKVCCTTINKVCSSGLKSVMFAAQSIILGNSSVVVAGGFESMSNVPYYVDTRARGGLRMGDGKLIDGMIHDGLFDPHYHFHMGMCAEDCSKKYNFSRQEQDDYAIRSYQRAAKALEKGYFKDEIVPVPIQTKKEVILVNEDEEIKKVDYAKISSLKPAFDKSGTVTAANSSKLNDGASALIITSVQYAKKNNLKPLAKIVSFADAEKDPIEFPTAPSLAIPIALKRAQLTVNDIDFWEINEAFSVVALANIKELGLDAEKTNVLGGAVAIGHPIGSSGGRLLTTLVYHLQRTSKKYGCVAICNGGGGASAMIVEHLT